MPTTESISAAHEIQHLQQQETLVERIRQYYLRVLAQISPLINAGAPRAVINRKLNKSLEEMVRNTVGAIEKSMSTSWEISNAKTKAIVAEKYKGIELPEAVQKALDDHRGKALQQFISRKESGLTLSERIWQTADQYKDLINEHLDEGIKEGKPAREISKKIREALQNPQGQDKPGRGVYKSPLKNTERVGRTEVNMSYRMADHHAWLNDPLVVGYRINLSATGKPKARCELCKTMAGDYPKSFVFRGFHPHCLCFKTPILMSRETLDKYNKLIAQGKDTPEAIAKLQKGELVDDVPQAFKDWVINNVKRVEGWANEPFFWKDNRAFIEKILEK